MISHIGIKPRQESGISAPILNDVLVRPAVSRGIDNPFLAVLYVDNDAFMHLE